MKTKVLKFQTNNRIIGDLYLYLIGSESISGLGSNFNACIQVIDASPIQESSWGVKIHHTAANDGQYHLAMAGKLDNITKIKSARRVLKQCSFDLVNRLQLIWSESPGKVSGYTREYMQYEYNKIYIDLSALAMLRGNLSILDLEALARDSKRKKEFAQLIKNTKELCDSSFKEYIEAFHAHTQN